MREFRAVRLAQINEIESIIQPQGYKIFCKSKGFKSWISHKMWKLLMKWRMLEPYFHKEKIYTYGESQAAETLDLLAEGLFKIAYETDLGNIDKYCCLVGGKQFHDIVKGFYNSGVITLSLDRYKYHHNGYQGTIFGIPFHVIPWMDGAIVVPKIIMESKS